MLLHRHQTQRPHAQPRPDVTYTRHASSRDTMSMLKSAQNYADQISTALPDRSDTDIDDLPPGLREHERRCR